MDARPFRPRGTENMPPTLHQRHKSTGNLAGMMSASTAGLRGPAKRAAFGDVTNLAKNTGNAREDGKVLKTQASFSVAQGQLISHVNKENFVYNGKQEAFTRPAQRATVLVNKTKPSAEVESEERSSLPSETSERKAHVEFDTSAKPQGRATHDHAALAYLAEPHTSSLPQNADEKKPLQPRHHKSQPQLKKQQQQQQQTLRRTQSRLLGKVDRNSDIHPSIDEDPISRPSEPSEDMAFYQAYLEAGSVLPTSDSQQEEASYEPAVEPPARLPDIKENVPEASIAYEDILPPQPLSEAEEYWDEDEDDYEDQDQAYTTAHSFRSRDMTTGGITTMLQPKLTTRVKRELEEAKLEVQRTTSQDDIDEELWDVSMVAEYGDEIFEYMREMEKKMLPNPHYMEIQTEIQWSMRSVLMDWLVQVHNRFCLLPETLFLTVNYIDRFLSAKVVSIGKLQLVGATALLVASKYEEINCPSLQEIVYMVDGGYSIDEILKAERFMLSMLSFELGWPGPMSFLRRVSKADDYDLETRTLAKYFLELTIMDERFVASPPSFLAAGAHCLSRLILKKGDWTKSHVHYSRFTWSQLKPLVTLMLDCCEHPRLHHSAIFEKYSERRFKEASTVVQNALDAGFALPQASLSSRPSRSLPLHLDDAPPQLQYPNGMLLPIEG